VFKVIRPETANLLLTQHKRAIERIWPFTDLLYYSWKFYYNLCKYKPISQHSIYQWY